MENSIPGGKQKKYKPAEYFQGHLKTYVVMMAYFWILWFFVGWRYSYNALPWPVWPMITWGLGVLIHYIYTTQTKK
jgi:cytochrome c oxidase assembly factor CtaG